MTLNDAFSLFGGLGLFLYGMRMMSDGLEEAAGEKMRKIMEKLTSSTFMGVVVGTVITAIIQSSSATTVMLVGFVNSGLMQLSQTVGIIMGANIGATMNGVLLAVGIGDIAPAIEFLGVCLIIFCKDKKKKQIGVITAGLGILFIGMNMMSGAMYGLRDSQMFVDMITTFRNPLIGILVGTVFTAIIQSSSASVGILEALAAAGLVSLDSGIYVMFGFTIGTCITAAIASIGTRTNAKRVAIIHLLYNVIGTIIFVFICELLPFVEMIEWMFPNSRSAQVANAHVIFKVVTTILLYPFGKALVKLSEKIIKDKEEPGHRKSISERAKTVAGYSMGTSAVVLSLIKEEIFYMYSVAKKNVEMSFNAVIKNTDEYDEEIRKNEDELDLLNKDISKYISSVMSNSFTNRDSQIISGYFRIVGNIERIGDHAMNFADYTKFFISTNTELSDRAIGEVENMKNISLYTMDLIMSDHTPMEKLVEVAQQEQYIDDLTEEYRNAQMERMKNTTCSAEASVIYAEMLTDFERIGDHLLNIAQEVSTMPS